MSDFKGKQWSFLKYIEFSTWLKHEIFSDVVLFVLMDNDRLPVCESVFGVWIV